MIKIELTNDEIQFLLSTLAQVNISLQTPQAAQLAAVGRAVIEKLEAAATSKEPKEKK